MMSLSLCIRWFAHDVRLTAFTICCQHVTLLLQMLLASQAEVAALSQELAIAKVSRGSSSSPILAAFEALESKIASLEAAAAAQHQQTTLQQQQHQQQQLGALLAGLSSAAGAAGLQQLLAGLPGSDLLAAVSQQYEAALAAKAAELEGFRLQLEGLLGAARQLQQQRTAGDAGSTAV
jgi:hypothetical protein